MGVLDHVWGESVAVDRVWAQVAGLRPSSFSRRFFVTLQAFVDESDDGHLFVFGGAVSSVERWAQFSADWEHILPLAPTRPDGKHHFKFSEMAGRTPDIPAFWQVLQENVDFIFASVVEIPALRAAQARISMAAPVEWGQHNDPYIVAFRILMDGFHSLREQFSSLLQPEAKVDFYFDEHSNREKIHLGWNAYMEGLSPEVRARFGHEPRFEDDTEFLPLQAADFVAGYSRAKGRTPQGRAVNDILLKYDKARIPHVVFSMKEDELVKWLAARINNQGWPIRDSKTGQRLRGRDDSPE